MLEHFFICPYCHSEISILVDTNVSEQSYTENCEVCSNPIHIHFTVDAATEKVISFEAEKTNE